MADSLIIHIDGDDSGYRKALEMGIGVKLHLWDVPTLA